jgi:hypothetical protein
MQQMQPYGQPGYGQQPPQGYAQQAPGLQLGQQPMHPHVQEALTQLDLLAGEQVMYSIIGDGFFLGKDPISKMIGSFISFRTKLCCGHNRVFLVLTNQRILVLRSFRDSFMGTNISRGVLSVALAGLKEVGNTKDIMCWCFHTRTVQLQTMTQAFNLVISKMRDAEVRSFITNVAAVSVSSSQRSNV